MAEIWPRSWIPRLLPGITTRMYDNWYRTGFWEPEFPPAGSGNRAVVTLTDLEGLGVLLAFAPYLVRQGTAPYRDGAPTPSWAEIRRAVDVGGVWLASGRSWAPWKPGVDPVPLAGVLVNVGAVVADVRAAVADGGGTR